MCYECIHGDEVSVQGEPDANVLLFLLNIPASLVLLPRI